MRNEEYAELHALKSDKEVRRFMQLSRAVGEDESIDSIPITKIGFTPGFVEAAKKHHYDVYGELASVSSRQLKKDFTGEQLKELMDKINALEMVVESEPTKIVAIAANA